MKIGVTVMVPQPVYSMYAEAAELLEDRSVAEVMSQVLQAYAKCLLDGLCKEHLSAQPESELKM